MDIIISTKFRNMGGEGMGSRERKGGVTHESHSFDGITKKTKTLCDWTKAEIKVLGKERANQIWPGPLQPKKEGGGRAQDSRRGSKKKMGGSSKA